MVLAAAQETGSCSVEHSSCLHLPTTLYRHRAACTATSSAGEELIQHFAVPTKVFPTD